MRRKHLILYFIILFVSLPLYMWGQKQRNYIYVFDCTASMKTYGIWDKAKQWLKDDIARQADDASFVIVPFRDDVDEVLQFESKKEVAWKNLEKEFDQLITNKHRKTGICHAWKKAVNYLASEKDNYFILLTDGRDEYDGPDAVRKLMKDWCRDHTHDYGFYVTLTDEAKNNLGTVSFGCDKFFVIDGHLVPFGAFSPDEITVSVRELKPKTLAFSTSGHFSAQVKANDPNFDVVLRDGEIRDGKAVFDVKPRQSVEQLIDNLPDHYQLQAEVTTDSSQLYITNRIITVNVDNLPVRNLDFRYEQSSGSTSWYDSFFFWPEAQRKYLVLDTESAWNKLAVRDGSSIKLHAFSETLADRDYEVYLNGEKVDKNAIILKATDGGNDSICILLAKDAPEGKHFISFRAGGDNLHLIETVNDQQVNSFEHVMRVKYNVVWNPMKWILLILLLVIAGLLILWFAVLRSQFYPHFRIARAQVEAPYFSSKGIRGKRKLVFANKKVRQSALNRFFTGEIVTEVSSEWTDPVEMTPFKKGAKIKTAGKYSVDPYAFTLMPQNTYTLQHNENHKKYILSIF